MKILSFIVIFVALSLFIPNSAFAERDWEYWSQSSVSVPLNEKVNFLIMPEWRFKNDMHNVFLFKLENGLSFKINKYWDITPYYVYQQKKSSGIWDKSDIGYLDATFKTSLENLFNLKLANRFRYQYDFDKEKTILRNSLKISKTVKIGKLELAPYISEEPFYDAKLGMFNEHRASVGVGYNFSKNVSLSAGYLLNPKKSTGKWRYTNVLITNCNIKF